MSGRESFNLTEVQRRAIESGSVNLSDAHAKQRLLPGSRRALIDVFDSFVGTRGGSRPDLAEFFTAGLSRHTGQAYPPDSSQLVYSASVALAVAAQFLRRRMRRTVGVITPTVDSLPSHFSNVGLLTAAVPERWVLPECDFARLDDLNLDALVVVTPNNPTGARMSRAALTELILWSARRGVELILDMSFRLHDPDARWDVIGVSDEIGADVIVVDDTGKTVSLGGVKLAVVSATRDLRAEVSRACSDVLLTVPELDLLLLGTLLHAPEPGNEVHRARKLIRDNTAYLVRQLDAVGCHPSAAAADDAGFQPSVAWIAVGPARDRIVEACRVRSLEVTVGEHYHWEDGAAGGAGRDLIRVALLRDADYLAHGAELLAEAIASTARDAS